MEITFTPWRLEYIKSEKKNGEGCIFCSAFEQEPSIENLVVFKNDKSAVLLNKYPYNNGHLLVVPRKHTDSLAKLDIEETFSLSRTLTFSEEALRKIYNPQGINIGMNLGLAAGAGITEHIHYHILPRWFGDTNFATIISDFRAIPENLSETYEKVKEFFDSLSNK